jgi:acyl-CoA thioester hydrolase
MFTHETLIRVGYTDTDQMGYLHHSKYVVYCETARIEAMREMGCCYKEIEDRGIFMPVISMKFNFMKPAFYDDLLTVKTILREMPRARMKFEYEFYNQAGIMINSAEVTLAFIHNKTRKPCFPPEFLLESLNKYFLVKELEG